MVLAVQLRKTYPALAAGVATQVELLSRAAQKLPSFVAAQCLLERSLYEQASSEASASLRAFPKGRLAWDLTAGMGVDTLALAQNFEQVMAIELDETRAALLCYNLAKLGVGNVTVVHAPAEDFLQSYDGLAPDIIFLDPARRTDKLSKAIRLEDCEPNLLDLLPQLREINAQVWVKLSPLYDVQAALRIDGCTQVTVLSVAGEVKEIVALLDFNAAEQATIVARALWHTQVFQVESHESINLSIGSTGAYIILPDAAVQKAGLLAAFAAQFLPAGSVATHPQGYLLALTEPKAQLPGRIYQLLAQMPYNEKKLKAYLKTQGVMGATINQRQFPLPVTAIRKTYGLAEGDPGGQESYNNHLFFTTTQQGKMVYHGRQIN